MKNFRDPLKGLIISSDHSLYEKYKDVGDPITEMFYAPSLEVAQLLANVHNFNFAIMNNIMYGRVPGIEPNVAIFRDDAGAVYGSKILNEKGIPYIIISERPYPEQLPAGCLCYMNSHNNHLSVDRMFQEKKVINYFG